MLVFYRYLFILDLKYELINTQINFQFTLIKIKKRIQEGKSFFLF